MDWSWIIGGLVIFAVVGMFKTARRNKDPIYHNLLALLYNAAEITDDIYDDCIEMQQLLTEVRKMQELDGGLQTGKRLAHLSSMTPYYGSVSPLTRARAETIVARIVRNGVPLLKTYQPSISKVDHNQE